MGSPQAMPRFQFALDLLSEVLNAKTKDYAKIEAVSTGAGLVSEVYRIQLSDNTSLHSSIIIKIPNHLFKDHLDKNHEKNENINPQKKRDEINHMVHTVCNLHNREVQFYRFITLESNVNLKLPQFFHGDYLNEDTNGLIIIEDFTSIMDIHYSERLTISLDQVFEVMQQIALLQSIKTEEVKGFPLLDSQLESLSNCIFLSANVLFHRKLPWFHYHVFQKILKISEMKSLRKLLTIEEKVLCHGDMSLKNTLWKNENGPKFLAMISWTSLHAGCRTTDLATLLAINLDQEERHVVEPNIIREFVKMAGYQEEEGKITEMYRKSLEFGLLKLLIVLVTNPEWDTPLENSPDGVLSRRLRQLIEEVLTV
ncbi:unnamed protein product [Bursaphelenchus okinawaensis]|uniref:CHK kinase-like domain-containing protein n=1 Tax=Bursaphelenchus okinawaensis TaxID=465554 RepID=A0A811LAG7_9BILA|nr:unnamed protein product [Bursaphelenchus okinawaensis]CAG9120760.1 unnamed protein product [Bursaphelenchus okinawaensis]